ncbi:MAG: universal stress protein, partial [Bacteroidota bacterium]
IEEFSELIKAYGFKDASFTISNNVFPSDGILELAKEREVDLIAMATHARRGISHWLSGSITEDTVNHIDLPVWTFKLDLKADNKELGCFKEAKGTPAYKKIEMITI